MKRSFAFFAMLAAVILAGSSPAISAVSENFDGLTQAAYGTYDYNGWHMENTMCNSVNARSGNAPRLRNADSPLPFLEYRGGDGNGKDGGVGTISFWYRSWDNDPPAVYDVKVNINGAGWTTIGTQINTTSIVYAEWTYALNNPSDNIIVRVERVTGVLGERLHIDDFTIGDFGGDTTPPTIASVGAISATQVDVRFSELVTVATCEVEGNYSINNGIGTPSLALRDGTNPALVHLTVSTLTEDLLYTITVNNVADSAGNAILPNSTAQFTYHDYAGDIVITEIMPNPAVVLDNFGEWFEVYNATATAINLNGWILHDNAGADTVEGDSIVASHDYFVFCNNDTLATNGGVPTDYDYVYGTSGWGLALSNTADVLYLLTPQGVAIDCVRYTTSWPWGTGSSMQLKDVALNNDDVNNWCASQNVWLGSAGDKGTPGQASDCAAPPDTVALTICQARLQDGCGVPTYLDTLIRVKGIVSFMDTCMHIAFLQDGGCGIALYGTSVSTVFPPPANRMIRPGDSIVVDGYLTQYAGLSEIAFAFGYTPEVALLDSDKAVIVTDLDCSLISYAADAGDDSCSGDMNESEKIQVDDIDFFVTGTFSPGDMNYLAKCANGDTIEVRIDSCSTFLDDPIPDGVVTVIGILGQYDWDSCYCQGYQIFPMEFIEGGPPDDPDSLTAYHDTTYYGDTLVHMRWTPGDIINYPIPAGYMIYQSLDLVTWDLAAWTNQTEVLVDVDTSPMLINVMATSEQPGGQTQDNSCPPGDNTIHVPNGAWLFFHNASNPSVHMSLDPNGHGAWSCEWKDKSFDLPRHCYSLGNPVGPPGTYTYDIKCCDGSIGTLTVIVDP